MQLLQGLSGLAALPPQAVVSIGNFDGVHLGHQAILQIGRDLAKTSGAALCVATFEPHPLTVLKPQQAPPRLTPPAIKQALLERLGAEFLVTLPPQREVLDLTAERFLEILRDRVRPAHVVEGASFRFGKGAAGTVDKLRQWARGAGVEVHVAPSVGVVLANLEIALVSSSMIRFLLHHGRVREAASALGRAYLLQGTVIEGAKRGRELGYPTANLEMSDQLIPADAVYAGRCRVGDQTYPAAISIGTNPTFGGGPRTVEAHLIGFAGDLYGRTLELEFIDWLREQRQYNDRDMLKAQMLRDLEITEHRMHWSSQRTAAWAFGRRTFQETLTSLESPA